MLIIIFCDLLVLYSFVEFLLSKSCLTRLCRAERSEWLLNHFERLLVSSYLREGNSKANALGRWGVGLYVATFECDQLGQGCLR